MKVRTAAISDYDWIKAMAQRHKKELEATVQSKTLF